ncbi:YeeE/YedE family protein [Paraglaciecola sp.]|uniref:YeeE/YedE family protein n=1 Tax=Paraglaciecola sp. TaxID=1920173 RepID=UPI003EF7AB99
MNNVFIEAFLGGMLIGLGAILLMLLNGRIAGISGILHGALTSFSIASLWRWAFIVGLVLAPLVASFGGFSLPASLPVDLTTLIVAGLIVGVGTKLGSGCTSGHGICGIGRLSKRSIVATMIFMSSAIVTVALTKFL